MSYITPDELDTTSDALNVEINLLLSHTLEIEKTLRDNYGVPAGLIAMFFEDATTAGSLTQKRWDLIMTDHRPPSFSQKLKNLFRK